MLTLVGVLVYQKGFLTKIVNQRRNAVKLPGWSLWSCSDMGWCVVRLCNVLTQCSSFQWGPDAGDDLPDGLVIRIQSVVLSGVVILGHAFISEGPHSCGPDSIENMLPRSGNVVSGLGFGWRDMQRVAIMIRQYLEIVVKVTMFSKKTSQWCRSEGFHLCWCRCQWLFWWRLCQFRWGHHPDTESRHLLLLT